MNTTMNAYCIELFYAKSGFRDQLINELQKLVKITRSEPGCLQCDLIKDKNNFDLIILILKFSSEELTLAHENQEHIKEFAENVMPKYCDQLKWFDATE